MSQASQGQVSGPGSRSHQGMLRSGSSVASACLGCQQAAAGRTQTTGLYLPRVLTAGRLRSGCQQGPFLVEFSSGLTGIPPLAVSSCGLVSVRVEIAAVLSYKDTGPIMSHPHPMTSFDTVQAVALAIQGLTFSADPSCHAFCPRGHAQVCPHTPLPPVECPFPFQQEGLGHVPGTAGPCRARCFLTRNVPAAFAG